MKTLKSCLVVLFVLSLVAPVFAQTQINVASDSSSGTYNKLLGEIIGVCNNENLSIKSAVGVTGGAVGNLDALFNNKADAAFLHSDVYVANAQSDPTYKELKTLLALWKEPVHVLALKQSKTKKLGTFSFGTQDFNSLDQLVGFKVGAAGGGAFTAQILQGQGQGGFLVNTYNKGDEVIAALDNGEIAAAIFVGAAPLPNIEKLDKNKYKLLPIGDSIAGRVKGVYRVANINYPGMTTGPIQTLAPVATLMTRKFSTERKTNAQREFRQCFYANLAELKDNASRTWLEVDPADHGVLDWLDIPEAASPAKPAKK